VLLYSFDENMAEFLLNIRKIQYICIIEDEYNSHILKQSAPNPNLKHAK